jgi:CBS domain containing-hemolysin-like protein
VNGAAGLLVAAALLLANAFFVGAEFAAVSVRRSQIEPLARTSRRARRVLEAQRHLSLMLAGAQFGITLCSLGLGAVAEPTVAALLEEVLHALHVPAQLTHPIAFAVALTVVVVLHMVVGEMVPKNVALATSERAAIILVPALATFVRMTGPLISAFNHMANGVLRVLGVDPQDELKSAYTPDELAEILAESRSEGLLAPEEHDRLAGALHLAARTAGDVAIAPDRLVTLPPDATAQDVQSLAASSGFSRFPILDGDRMLGFVHVKDVLDADAGFRAGSHARQMPQVAADTPLPDVVTALRQGGSHMASVVGLGEVRALALEDVLGELLAPRPA